MEKDWFAVETPKKKVRDTKREAGVKGQSEKESNPRRGVEGGRNPKVT